MATNNDINCPLPVSLANGGSAANLTASNGGIVYSTASAMAILSGTATALQMLQSGTSSAPAWSTTTWPATTTANQILYSSSTSVIGQITTADSAVLVTNSSGAPAFSGTMTNGQLIIGSTTATPTAATLTAGAGISITNGAGSITIAASGGGGTGIISQVQTGTLLTTASSSSNTPASTGLSVTITPSSSSSTILISAFVNGYADGSANNSIFLFLYRGSSTNLIGGSSPGSRTPVACFPSTGIGSYDVVGSTIQWLDSPATTSAVTYYIYFAAASNAATVWINKSSNDTNQASVGRAGSFMSACEVL